MAYAFWLVPLAIIALGVWLVLMIPVAIAAFIGWAAMIALIVGAVGFVVLSIFASAMAS